MPESLQLSIDLATSLSIIFAAGAFIYQQWKENYEKKELGLWQEIKEVIDSQADTMLESSRILIQMEYNPDEIQEGQEDLIDALVAGFTELLNITNTVKFRVRLDSKQKIEALLKRQGTYEAKKNKLDKIFCKFDRECNDLINQILTMRRGFLVLLDAAAKKAAKKAAKEAAIELAEEAIELAEEAIKFAKEGLRQSILGDAFYSPEEKAKFDEKMAALGIAEIFSLYILFEKFSKDLLDLSHNK